MKDFINKLKEFATKRDRGRYRDWRGHYASGNLTCMRDQYWKLTGEPETNTTDFTGSMKMMVGDAIEKGLVDALISKLHYLGYHLRSVQGSVGGSNPNWNGYLDALIDQRVDGGWRPFVVEIKSKSGIGANFFYDRPEPSKEYMTQLGLYLHDLYNKKGITDGCFLYLLLSDKHFGTLVQVNCKYDPETTTIRAYSFSNTDGRMGNISASVNITDALARWVKLEEHIKNKDVPKGEYRYKHDLTQEMLRSISDNQLKKLIEGKAVIGDWNVIYSRYFDKQLEADGVSKGRSLQEKKIALVEYIRRHPKSKLTVEE